MQNEQERSQFIELQNNVRAYNDSVTRRLDEIEVDLGRMEAENARLLAVKDAAYIERDACVGLIAQLAQAQGLTVGVAAGNRVVVDLPSGQVSWTYGEGEAHLFEGLPAYPGAIEELPIDEMYGRVMNPGISSS